MKKLVLITNAFPYLPGEQFIQEEILYWAEQKRFSVTILPIRKHENRRTIPDNIVINDALISTSKLKFLLCVIKALIDPRFFREIATLLKLNKFSRRTLSLSLTGTARIIHYDALLKQYIRTWGCADVVYCYWNNFAAYAASDIYKKTHRKVVVSRIHRGDIYEDQSKCNYLPLKRQYVNGFDRVFCLSDNAKDYLTQHFLVEEKKLAIAKLGVSIAHSPQFESTSNAVHIVSCSFCTPVKRVDKIINSIRILSELCPERTIRWTHIGGGPLTASLIETANISYTSLKNISYEFKGTLSNSEVLDFYNTEYITVFINLSESEGIPVSIMEAMARGIPSIAPDIGGINTLVDSSNGALLPSHPSSREAAQAMLSIINLPTEEAKKTRQSAYQKIASEFNGRLNYESFIGELESLSDGEK